MNRRLVPDSALSFAQERIWLLAQFAGPDTAYNVPLVVRFPGAVDAAAMQASLHDVVTRHEILRTRYADIDGRAQPSLCDPDTLPQLTVESSPADRLGDRVREVSQHHFDLADQLPLRAWLISSEGGGAGAVLVLVVHHIAFDEASLAPLLEDLGTAYSARRAGKRPAWASLDLQYRDYAARQREFLGDPLDPRSLFARQRNYWVTQLSGLPKEIIPLPVDRPRPAVPDARGEVVVMTVPDELRQRITELARAERVTPFTLLRAALAAFLSAQGVGDDIPLAGFVTGRFDGALDRMVGFFVNTLVFRIDVSGAPSFRELVRRTRSVDIDAYSNQDIPFEEVVRALNPPRSWQRHPLAQVAISYFTVEAYALPGTDAQAEIGEQLEVRFDVEVNVFDTDGRSRAGRPEGMYIEWVHSVALWNHETVELMVREFREFLDQLVDDPDRQLGVAGSAPAVQR